MASSNSAFLPKRLADAYFSGSFKFILVSSVPSESDLDTFDFRSDITNEVANSGTYSSGGSSITCSVGAVDTTNNRVPVTFGSPSAWTGATISAVGGWIYKDVGTAATDELIGFVDFVGVVDSIAGAYTVILSAPLYVNR